MEALVQLSLAGEEGLGMDGGVRSTPAIQETEAEETLPALSLAFTLQYHFASGIPVMVTEVEVVQPE
jgi:hypothetical protein